MSISERRMILSADSQKLVFGQFDAFAKIIVRSLHLTIITRDDEIKIGGDAERVADADEG